MPNPGADLAKALPQRTPDGSLNLTALNGLDVARPQPFHRRHSGQGDEQRRKTLQDEGVEVASTCERGSVGKTGRRGHVLLGNGGCPASLMSRSTSFSVTSEV